MTFMRSTCICIINVTYKYSYMYRATHAQLVCPHGELAISLFVVHFSDSKCSDNGIYVLYDNVSSCTIYIKSN